MCDLDEAWKSRLPFELSRESAKLLANAQTGYDHRGGRGEHREDILLKFLARRLPPSTGLSKAEIADSRGLRTGEFDIVLFDSMARLVLAEAGESRIVVPVESVQAIIEVRTTLTANYISEISDKLDQLAALTRLYKRTLLTDYLMADQPLEELDAGIPACALSRWTLPILTYVVGYDVSGEDSLLASLNKAHSSIEGVVCIGRFSAAKSHNEWTIGNLGHLSLSIFLTQLLGHLTNHRRIAGWVTPDYDRYLKILLNGI